MASDLISERRAAWQACLDEIQPQIRGLEDKQADALSDELRVAIKDRLAFLKVKEGLIFQAIGAQDGADAAQGALEDHGFPSVPDMVIPANLLEEFDREVDDTVAARSGFEAAAQAASLNVDLGTPQSKSKSK